MDCQRVSVNFSFFLIIILSHVSLIICKIHELNVESDNRKRIPVSTFGFFQGGTMEVKISNLISNKLSTNDTYGFSIDRTMSNGENSFLDTHPKKCPLQDEEYFNSTIRAVIFMITDFNKEQFIVNCGRNMKSLLIFPDKETLKKQLFPQSTQEGTTLAADKISALNPDDGESITVDEPASISGNCSQIFPLVKDKLSRFSANFVIYIPTEREEGLYHLFFHNCQNYGGGSGDNQHVLVSFRVDIEERNMDNFLSAGEMPLPFLYFFLSFAFFVTGCFWVHVLVNSRHPVFKIHYLMATLVFLKTLSLLFHGINYYFIQARGERVATWAILFYVFYFIRGSVLITTIILIGTGWTLIKFILSEKEKKIFIVAIPLQVLANFAYIIKSESEEGDPDYENWSFTFLMVDLLCCGAILFPAVWSIRHLQEASHIDGKAAINLQKLKLFRQFYIIIFCYVYFSRLMKYFIKVTVPFQYEWLTDLFFESSVLTFFILSGSKFRPSSTNPYFRVNTEDDDEIGIVISQCGVTEGIKKLSRYVNDEEHDTASLLVSKREINHDYD